MRKNVRIPNGKQEKTEVMVKFTNKIKINANKPILDIKKRTKETEKKRETETLNFLVKLYLQNKY